VVDLSLDGRQAAICWTDPPYNVELGTGGNYAKFSGRTVANDNLRDKFPEFVAGFCAQIERALQPGAVLYMTMGSQEWPTVDGLLRDAGFHWSSTIIWVKQQFVLARKDYHTQFEPMWYGWKTGDGDEAVDLDVPGAVEEYLRHYAQGYDAMWYGWKRGAARLQKVKDRKQGDVWFFDRPTSSPEHPTMKPLELVERSLENSSRPGDLVFDPFGGSGTTMCVAERLGRLCSMVELLPKYCAVVLERMTLMGCRPVRVSQEVQE
jgi:DNA modification methylase